MNKWLKILQDTDHNQLNDSQRLWRCIAFLRLNNTTEAENTHTQGSFEFKSSSKASILLAEISLKNGDSQKACSILESNHKQSLAENQSKDWYFLAKRLKKPSKIIKKIINENNTNEIEKNSKEWKKIIGLKIYKNDFNAHFAYLKSLCQEKQPTEQISELTLKVLQTFELSSFQYYQIQKLIIEKISWLILIKELFTRMNIKTNDRIRLWDYWLRICPDKFRKNLLSEMKKYLKFNPELKLEKYLDETVV